MSLDRRNCISRNESMANLPSQYHPQYYKFYTKEGCIIECRAKYSMNKCGCLPYYYPQFEKDAYCNSTGLKCLASISGIFNNVISVSKFITMLVKVSMIPIFFLYFKHLFMPCQLEMDIIPSTSMTGQAVNAHSIVTSPFIISYVSIF